jgi:hypothetical protein
MDTPDPQAVYGTSEGVPFVRRSLPQPLGSVKISAIHKLPNLNPLRQIRGGLFGPQFMGFIRPLRFMFKARDSCISGSAGL